MAGGNGLGVTVTEHALPGSEHGFVGGFGGVEFSPLAQELRESVIGG